MQKALDKQVGGSHYKKYKYQPLEFAEEIGLTPTLFSAFKYLVRYKDKAKPVEDLDKALHCIQCFVEFGKTKELFIRLRNLTMFLGQFEPEHSQVIISLLHLQTAKEFKDDIEVHINNLKANIAPIPQAEPKQPKQKVHAVEKGE